MEASKDRTPYFNYISPPNTSIRIRSSPIIHQISPLSGPAIGTSFKNPIPYIVHLRQTNCDTPSNKISLNNPYLSDRFSQMNIDSPVPLPASPMNSIRAKLMKDMPKPVPNTSKKRAKDKYNKVPYETPPAILPNWPGWIQYELDWKAAGLVYREPPTNLYKTPTKKATIQANQSRPSCILSGIPLLPKTPLGIIVPNQTVPCPPGYACVWMIGLHPPVNGYQPPPGYKFICWEEMPLRAGHQSASRTILQSLQKGNKDKPIEVEDDSEMEESEWERLPD